MIVLDVFVMPYPYHNIFTILGVITVFCIIKLCHGIYFIYSPELNNSIWCYFTIQFFVVVNKAIPIPAGMAIPSFRHSVVRRFVSSLNKQIKNVNRVMCSEGKKHNINFTKLYIIVNVIVPKRIYEVRDKILWIYGTAYEHKESLAS